MKKTELSVAVGHIPSGLFIVCAQDGEKKDGFLASWVQQVSFSPLLVSLAIKPGRPSYEAIVAGKPFTINIVGEHETQYMRHFWSGYKEGTFGEISHRVSERGGILINDARSVLECKMILKSRPGDHDIVFAQVLESYIAQGELTSKVHLRKTGLDY